MGKLNVIIVDATGNKEQKVGLPDNIKCGIIMVKLVEKIKLPSVGPDGNPISYKFIHKVTGRQLLETQTLAEAGIKDGDVLRLQPEITAGAFCDKCGQQINEGESFCSKCGNPIAQSGTISKPEPSQNETSYGFQPAIEKPKKSGMAKIICNVLGVISGIVSIIFGFIVYNGKNGLYIEQKSYGGDAYTGIQNAMAEVGSNINYLNQNIQEGLGYVLIAIGLIAIFYFIGKIVANKGDK